MQIILCSFGVRREKLIRRHKDQFTVGTLVEDPSPILMIRIGLACTTEWANRLIRHSILRSLFALGAITSKLCATNGIRRLTAKTALRR